jgi:hypothetical protein
MALRPYLIEDASKRSEVARVLKITRNAVHGARATVHFKQRNPNGVPLENWVNLQSLLAGIYWSLRDRVLKADELLREPHFDVLTTAALSNTPHAAAWAIA